MSKREEKNNKNTNFLRKILEHKSALFDQFSPTITKETRKQAWGEVRDYAVSIGLVTNNRDMTYIRDTTWQNLRGRTMAKLDKQTGAAGGIGKRLDDIDHLVLEIIGKNSPVVNGLGVEDSLGDTQYIEIESASVPIQANTSTVNTQDPIETLESFQNDTATEQPSTSNSRRPAIRKRTVVRSSDVNKEIDLLKKKKLELEVRKLEIETWSREKELNIQHSDLTSHIEPNTTEHSPRFTVNEEGQVVLMY